MADVLGARLALDSESWGLGMRYTVPLYATVGTVSLKKKRKKKANTVGMLHLPETGLV